MKKLIYNIKTCFVTMFYSISFIFSQSNMYLHNIYITENIFNERTYKDDVVDVGRGTSCLFNRASSATTTTSFYNRNWISKIIMKELS